eukprot:4354259-Alexandrium_andersonii.AAC.1
MSASLVGSEMCIRDRLKVQTLQSDGASPWNGRYLLQPGHMPQGFSDIGFAFDDDAPYHPNAPIEDVRYDRVLHGVWVKALRWVAERQ